MMGAEASGCSHKEGGAQPKVGRENSKEQRGQEAKYIGGEGEEGGGDVDGEAEQGRHREEGKSKREDSH